MRTVLVAASVALATVVVIAPAAGATSPESVPGVAIAPDNRTSSIYGRNGVNDNGDVVGGHDTGGETHGFLWHNGKLSDLGVLEGGNYSLATAVDDIGDIVGWSGDRDGGKPLHAVLWRCGRITDLGSLGGNSFPAAINNYGTIVGESAPDDQGSEPSAVRWRFGAMQVLPALPGTTGGTAALVNDRGDIAGVNVLATGGRHAVLWRGGKVVDLGPGWPVSLDQDGRLLVESVDAEGNAYRFIWVDGNRVTPPAGVTDIDGLGEHDQVFGRYQPNGSAERRGFLWYGSEFVDLGPFSPTSVNARGQVLGRGSTDGVAGVWYRGRITALLPVPGRGKANPIRINDGGLVAGSTGWDTATVWTVPVR
ncbi:hypothetical protein [Amycolatopsis sp. CA-230715]|uniref:hypothetical protein n=1 Tax=Amycolatopsis sp. CA-230715 TaxID=2745196 RepID=UPI001C031808|nr:hypothetical protein [Amycolatopsis sp. CA-230715]QWF84905.1 hypothetical protein HUW46_08357 [Amycolatopsis sp. CA-230715]